MLSIILRALNAPGLLLITAIGVAIQTSLFAWWPLTYIQPDIVLLLVIWCALRRSFTEGGILTLLLSNIAEIHSGSSRGLLLIAYMIVYLGVRLSSRMFVIPDLAAYVIVTLFASIGWKLSVLSVLQLLGVGANQWRHTLLNLFPGAVVEGLLSFQIYQWFERFDLATFKRPPTEQASLGDPDQIGPIDYSMPGPRQYGTARQDEDILVEM